MFVVKKIYETSNGDHDLKQSEIRWPRVGLRLIFGCGPWLWQQWACLRLEHKLRFEKGHEHDFEVMDIEQFALELWEIWLKDPRNTSFRNLYDRVGKSGQQELLDHIMAPFDLIDDVVNNSDGKWDFEDSDRISLFTYCSVLGAGYLEAFLIFALQISIPVALLFYYTVSNSGGADEKFALGTRLMLVSVFVYYLIKVTRDTITNFINVVGVLDTVTSRVRSLRNIVWENGNDSISQSLGFSLDLFMNTGYICLLYTFNIYILFNISDPFEIIGSVLFFEFLMDLDEELANTAWWDNGKRFFKAGVVGLILQSEVKEKNTVTKEAFLKRFISKVMLSSPQKEIDEFLHNVEQENLPDDSSFLQHQRGKNAEEINLLTISEKIIKKRDEYYVKIFEDASLEDEKQEVFFDSFLFTTDAAIFERHVACRAWSQWEKIIFCCPTPRNVPESYQVGTKLILQNDGFNDEEQVSNIQREASHLSNTYYDSGQRMTLIPQPDSSDLARGYSRWLQNTSSHSNDQSTRSKPKVKKSWWRRLNAKVKKIMYKRAKSESLNGFASEFMEVLLFFFTSLSLKSSGKSFTRNFHYIINLITCIFQVSFPFVTLLVIPLVYTTPWYCKIHAGKQCEFETFRGWNI